MWVPYENHMNVKICSSVVILDVGFVTQKNEEIKEDPMA